MKYEYVDSDGVQVELGFDVDELRTVKCGNSEWSLSTETYKMVIHDLVTRIKELEKVAEYDSEELGNYSKSTGLRGQVKKLEEYISTFEASARDNVDLAKNQLVSTNEEIALRLIATADTKDIPSPLVTLFCDLAAIYRGDR